MADKRLCWSCENFFFDSGSPGYSEYTPGSDAQFSCGAHVFADVDLGDLDDADDLRKLLEIADTCIKFTPRLTQEERQKKWEEDQAKWQAEWDAKCKPFSFSQEAKDIPKVLRIPKKTYEEMYKRLTGKTDEEQIKVIVKEILGYYPGSGEWKIVIDG